ncbi:hypothetical protein GYY_03015 [Methanococcus maripaludis X1]|uniref:Uncharacterized protein n=2 Tax=Methanococcus maripaludis TaxID=39152 RepID=G0H416_METMI|nr:hypothetical protein GYY_03015 [Methanococcus maripaludis X1]
MNKLKINPKVLFGEKMKNCIFISYTSDDENIKHIMQVDNRGKVKKLTPEEILKIPLPERKELFKSDLENLENFNKKLEKEFEGRMTKENMFYVFQAHINAIKKILT